MGTKAYIVRACIRYRDLQPYENTRQPAATGGAPAAPPRGCAPPPPPWPPRPAPNPAPATASIPAANTLPLHPPPPPRPHPCRSAGLWSPSPSSAGCRCRRAVLGCTDHEVRVPVGVGSLSEGQLGRALGPQTSSIATRAPHAAARPLPPPAEPNGRPESDTNITGITNKTRMYSVYICVLRCETQSYDVCVIRSHANSDF